MDTLFVCLILSSFKYLYLDETFIFLIVLGNFILLTNLFPSVISTNPYKDTSHIVLENSLFK